MGNRFRWNLVLSSISIFCMALFLGCNERTKVYEGSYIKIDYSQLFEDDIKDQSWIMIDGVKYTHYTAFDKIYKDEYSLPASRVRHKFGEKEQYEKYNRISIAIALGNFVDKVSTDRNQTTARVDRSKRYQMFTLGILNLERADSSSFKVEVPVDYPATITVIK